MWEVEQEDLEFKSQLWLQVVGSSKTDQGWVMTQVNNNYCASMRNDIQTPQMQVKSQACLPLCLRP